jgi:GNAT superfamily N-acetyltransferase
MEPRTIVRLYDADRDSDALRACIIDQQDFHRGVESSWPEGKAIIDEYMKYLETQCAAHDGCVIVADCGGEIAGFGCVVAETQGDSPDDPATFAWLHDMFVKAEYRRRGIATLLIAEAESFARAHGARILRLGVLEGNAGARSFYRERGFRDYARVLTKPLV